jgi:hypothetical protein
MEESIAVYVIKNTDPAMISRNIRVRVIAWIGLLTHSHVRAYGIETFACCATHTPTVFWGKRSGGSKNRNVQVQSLMVLESSEVLVMKRNAS